MGAVAVVKTMYGKYGKAGDAFIEAQDKANRIWRRKCPSVNVNTLSYLSITWLRINHIT